MFYPTLIFMPFWLFPMCFTLCNLSTCLIQHQISFPVHIRLGWFHCTVFHLPYSTYESISSSFNLYMPILSTFAWTTETTTTLLQGIHNWKDLFNLIPYIFCRILILLILGILFPFISFLWHFCWHGTTKHNQDMSDKLKGCKDTMPKCYGEG